MQNYIIRELQGVNSFREGKLVTAKNLSHAKTIASKQQVFFGTILVVESEEGLRLATKKNGKWTNN